MEKVANGKDIPVLDQINDGCDIDDTLSIMASRERKKEQFFSQLSYFIQIDILAIYRLT